MKKKTIAISAVIAFVLSLAVMAATDASAQQQSVWCCTPTTSPPQPGDPWLCDEFTSSEDCLAGDELICDW